ncbi:DDE-type integrase/transposase/recombinase [Streptomyces sp. SID13031]|nr:DDE-type integrase/transposase/recombinase [Streptomyces sp. SID13031]
MARCTVERLMKANGWHGVTRAKKVRTTVTDPAATRAPDLVNRQFTVAAPNTLLVADFTYVRLVSGSFVYTAFVIDAFAGRIVGWECSTSKHTAFVQRAITQAAAFRARQGNPLQDKAIRHSDAGSQYTAVRFTETLHRRRHRPLDRHRRRCLRQCSDRNLHRALQDRMHPRRLTVSPRTTDRSQQCRSHHRRLGPLVQHQPAHTPPRPTPTRRSRG